MDTHDWLATTDGLLREFYGITVNDVHISDDRFQESPLEFVHYWGEKYNLNRIDGDVWL